MSGPSNSSGAPTRPTTEETANREDMAIVTRFIGSFLLVGFLSLSGYSIAIVGWTTFGPMLWALAVGVAGMGVGFLFGIPKVLQAGAIQVHETRAPAQGDNQSLDSDGRSGRASDYRQRVNTNLEEISDWLTKIIVGLGLVQLNDLSEHLDKLSGHIASSFGDHPGSRGVALALVIFFVVIGFLYGYLMTRLYLQGALARAETDLIGTNRWLRDLEEKANAALAAAAAETKRRQTRPVDLAESEAEGTEDFESLWNSDPHKGFGKGKSVANGRRLSARIQPVRGASSVNRVHLTVTPTDPADPLDSPVTFHLHPTFDEPTVEVLPDREGVARLDILTAGVFTVGAETDNGETRLELDLAKVTGGSPEFYRN